MAAQGTGNAEQIDYWNGEAGLRWVRRQEMQDAVLAPISDTLMLRLAAAPGEKVIDIGCGCGASAIEIGRSVAPGGQVLGIDISTPMLARARERTPATLPVSYVEADATTYAFAAGEADALASRFGVMFFADPVASFANMRKALKPGGRVVFVCWREPRANPWFIAPLQAAYKHVPKMPEVGPEDPGPFAFANAQRVRSILESAGFTAVALEPVEYMIDLAVGLGLDAAVTTAMEIGPASRALDGQPEPLRAAAALSIRELLAPHLDQGGSVRLPGAVWIVTARAP